MKKRIFSILCITVCMLFIFSSATVAQEFRTTVKQEFTAIKLPAPMTDGGKPLMQALKARQTSREFRTDALPLQVISDLLWAAFGINRPESGRRTAPSAMNWQEIDIYVASFGAVYLYDAREHALIPVLGQDIRSSTGTQAFVGEAPVNLVYVADLSKMGGGSDEGKIQTAFADTGFIGQNVYLYCASEGLATVVRGSVDKDALAQLMGLRPEQRITLAQTVGYPK
ncbi:nitroreductase family protein [bacterium]|nr:nitroreductase family protein [bacterium]